MRSGLMRRGKKAVIAVSMIFSILGQQYAEAGTKIMAYQIRQETIRKHGVIVSKPKQQDAKIFELLKENNITSFEEYAVWLRRNIKYRKDRKGDQWTGPAGVLKRKYGDCEDLALLNMAVLRVLGYQPKFLAFFTAKEGHAVCVFKNNNKYYYFDNRFLKEIKEPDLQQFAENISTAKKYTEIKELDLKQRKWNLVYKNS